ncbi:hypothetical protein LY632_10545 [Erythrobacter sp. SDW2]|uniref:hypothetical protein n=1 Tax=Erythrobacter sp. SDW2 TaxID=2907154 RepID=UPI001F2E3DCD|nr:hypothetical protein [Erythrobacter sp. SDW2]UIP06130.1 hypothetical protein LY632_10545 [Erythrobacter sp. SDW2]
MMISKKMSAVAMLGAAALILTGCMLAPGKFTSELELQRDGRFTYRYDGEIYLLAMSQLAKASQRFGDEENEFIAQPCYDESWEGEDKVEPPADEAPAAELFAVPMAAYIPAEPVIIAPDVAEEAVEDYEDGYTFTERECTEEELAEQRADYDERMELRKKQAEQQAQMMNLFFGGLDPSDPESADELVKRLKRQRGWKSVEHLGNGKFQVSFELTGTMGHDFVFPTFERFPMNNFLLTAAVREPGTIRIDAPGFAVQGAEGPMGGMMSGMLGVMQIFGDEKDKAGLEDLPELDGTFAIITNGRIMANNTDEGPADVDGMQRLEWTINPRTRTAPMALIALD